MMPSTCESLGDNLIFIFSQPRAGSTMLQRILGSHPDVHTVPEPWIMLPLFLPLRPNGFGNTMYLGGAETGKGALAVFLAQLSHGQDTYVEGIRMMYGHLSQSALGRSGKRYFLDKTPPYFYIIPEIFRTFPRAKFLFLVRNPLAVLCSVVESWVQPNLFLLRLYKGELLTAPTFLLEGMRLLAGNCLVVHYETLVVEPAQALERVCSWLEIRFLPEMIDYGRSSLPRFSLGDSINVYKHDQPDSRYVDRWRDRLEDAQLWRLTRDYLHVLGPETISGLGYSFQHLISVVDQRKPPNYRFRPTLSLKCCMGEPNWRKTLWGNVVRLERACRKNGIGSVAVQAARRVAAALVP